MHYVVLLIIQFWNRLMETTDQQIRVEIERLRAQFPDTQDLYREVCTLLFFRIGVTPTANKLYQLVRKGSMSAPAEALAKFWNDLRQKSRVRIEHPDLPDELKVAAGDMVATLWSKAQTSAQDNFIAYRTESQTMVTEAKEALAKGEVERATIYKELENNHHLLTQARGHIQAIEQSLATERAVKFSLEEQLERIRGERTELQHALELARRDFSVELDKLQASVQLAEERFRASEQRALLEIDRERSLASKRQNELSTVRAAADQSAERQRHEVALFQAQIGDLRQKIGMLEGNLQALEAHRDRLVKELEDVRLQLTNASTQAASARVEVENWRRQVKDAKQSDLGRKVAGRAKPKVTSGRAPRKARTIV